MTEVEDRAAENYRLYRGKCKEMSEAAVAADPTLRLVRGYYFEPLWGREEQHWWTVRQDGTIFDPTRLQFPSGGLAVFYEEFDGTLECEMCGKTMTEDEAIMAGNGNHPVCSNACYGRLVGC